MHLNLKNLNNINVEYDKVHNEILKVEIRIGELYKLQCVLS